MIHHDFNRFQWQIVLAKLGRLTVGRFFSASFEVPEFYATLLKSFRAAIPTEPATECHWTHWTSLDLNQLNRSQQDIVILYRFIAVCSSPGVSLHLDEHFGTNRTEASLLRSCDPIDGPSVQRPRGERQELMGL